MNLLFTLSMPNRASWNARWSGEDTFYGIIQSFTTKKSKEKAKEILEKGYYYYNFGDGWGAAVTVTEVPKEKIRGVKKKLAGFCGYDWMVREIVELGHIKGHN